MNIVFICYGNICRSPMAEYIFKDMCNKLGYKAVITSRATSREEIGAPVHYGTKKILNGLSISCNDHSARKITKKECDEADLLICMDEGNIASLKNIAGEENSKKIFKLLDFSSTPRDILDPWYTHDFVSCYNDVTLGLNGLIEYLKIKR